VVSTLHPIRTNPARPYYRAAGSESYRRRFFPASPWFPPPCAIPHVSLQPHSSQFAPLRDQARLGAFGQPPGFGIRSAAASLSQRLVLDISRKAEQQLGGWAMFIPSALRSLTCFAMAPRASPVLSGPRLENRRESVSARTQSYRDSPTLTDSSSRSVLPTKQQTRLTSGVSSLPTPATPFPPLQLIIVKALLRRMKSAIRLVALYKASGSLAVDRAYFQTPAKLSRLTRSNRSPKAALIE
jgi:hypothetical protein